MNKKKMINIILMMLMLTLLLIGCTDPIDKTDIKKESVNVVKAEEMLKKFDNKETFTFIIGNDTCPACTAYKENLTELQEKENITLDYISLSDDEMDIVQELIYAMKQDVSEGLMTPTTYFVVDGVLEEVMVGPMEADELMKDFGDYLKPSK